MANEDIARLVGHAFGDGSIHKHKMYFVYTNSEDSLQESVRQFVNGIFPECSLNVGTSISKTPRYQYSNAIGRFLVKYGAPVGSKVLQETRVPTWIKDASQKVKASFVAALFDDEGYFRDSKNSMQIAFKAAKTISLEENLVMYLNDVRSLLYSLGIKCSEIKTDQTKHRKDGLETVSLRFWITGKENFGQFHYKIPLLHPAKIKKLKSMIPVR